MTAIIYLLLGAGLGVGLGVTAFRYCSRLWGSRRDEGDLLELLSHSPEGLGFAVCERAYDVSGRPVALVLRSPVDRVATVVGFSRGVDRRLWRSAVSPSSVAGRACVGDTPAQGTGIEALIGRAFPNRRRHAIQGTALPVRDADSAVGALLVFGPELKDAGTRRRLDALIGEAGPILRQLLIANQARHAPYRDETVGVANQKGLEEAVEQHLDEGCAIVSVGIDRFPVLAGELGASLTGAMLRHVGAVLRGALRDDDLTAFLGSGEFAVLLPRTVADDARLVTERLQSTVNAATFVWGGGAQSLTCSCGVACTPSASNGAAGLIAAARTAMQSARGDGRSRLEVIV